MPTAARLPPHTAHCQRSLLCAIGLAACLQVIPSNFQIRGMHTIIRDRETCTADYVFYSDRLLRLVVEASLGHLHFSERTVVTPTGHQYVGVDFAKKLCGVSIIRSGESMENALRACCKGIKIGKILVHRCVCGIDGSLGDVRWIWGGSELAEVLAALCCTAFTTRLLAAFAWLRGGCCTAGWRTA